MFTIELTADEVALLRQMIAGSNYQGVVVALRAELIDRKLAGANLVSSKNPFTDGEREAFRRDVPAPGANGWSTPTHGA